MTETEERILEQKKNRRKEKMLQVLKQKGFRLTSQRRLILDIILEKECSCSKEIYYFAQQKDPTIGIATVYRMIKLLEETEMLDRKNLYKLSCETVAKIHDGCTLILKNSEQIRLTAEDFEQAIQLILRQKGYQDITEVEKILL